jgi:hypothetical protein
MLQDAQEFLLLLMNTVYDTEWTTALMHAHSTYQHGMALSRLAASALAVREALAADKQRELDDASTGTCDAADDRSEHSSAGSDADTPRVSDSCSSESLSVTASVSSQSQGGAAAALLERLRLSERYRLPSVASSFERTLRCGKLNYPNPALATASANHNPLEGLQATCYKCKLCGHKCVGVVATLCSC